eukprot:CAMPEP_0171850990 /NCGR_PEP_ID=MMETSP0992-20121227/20703_1 /TAXON_ID=483369 /ORGANISM="non described non described, Strain CCMP2098" /LENGTH=54 /DNA_ID=CAMNT_0012470701 /DNA_START=22 /DNA_END=186 /DNA_ORIENTATION=+
MRSSLERLSAATVSAAFMARTAAASFNGSESRPPALLKSQAGSESETSLNPTER